jgi:hypothetical protein
MGKESSGKVLKIRPKKERVCRCIAIAKTVLAD